MNPVAGRQAAAPSRFRDHGGHPYAADIHEAAVANPNFRTAIWTGEHLQVTLMSINPGEEIGLEIHPDTDQFLRVEQGCGIVEMGRRPEQPEYIRQIGDDDAIMIPAGCYHNITNTGRVSLKLYSIYSPPHHPRGTVHPTPSDAMEAEKDH